MPSRCAFPPNDFDYALPVEFPGLPGEVPTLPTVQLRPPPFPGAVGPAVELSLAIPAAFPGLPGSLPDVPVPQLRPPPFPGALGPAVDLTLAIPTPPIPTLPGELPFDLPDVASKVCPLD